MTNKHRYDLRLFRSTTAFHLLSEEMLSACFVDSALYLTLIVSVPFLRLAREKPSLSPFLCFFRKICGTLCSLPPFLLWNCWKMIHSPAFVHQNVHLPTATLLLGPSQHHHPSAETTALFIGWKLISSYCSVFSNYAFHTPKMMEEASFFLPFLLNTWVFLSSIWSVYLQHFVRQNRFHFTQSILNSFLLFFFLSLRSTFVFFLIFLTLVLSTMASLMNNFPHSSSMISTTDKTKNLFSMAVISL